MGEFNYDCDNQMEMSSYLKSLAANRKPIKGNQKDMGKKEINENIHKRFNGKG